MNKLFYLIPVVIVVLSSMFIVDEREKALVLQFGQVQRVEATPGLAFKIPLIQNVVSYDDRILSRDVEPLEVTPLDDRRLVVDAFARFRIANVVTFRQAVGTGGLETAERRLDNILRSQIREVLGTVSSSDILSSDRTALMKRVRDGAEERASKLGLKVIDVRLKRTDLPDQNLDATYKRMRAEREREAADEVARGKEAAARIRAQADRTVVETVSDAERQADVVRGEADATRSAIFAEAFGRDPAFFDFYRSLAAYQNALKGSNTSIVMSPDNEFFDYLKTDTPAGTNIGDGAGSGDGNAESSGQNGARNDGGDTQGGQSSAPTVSPQGAGEASGGQQGGGSSSSSSSASSSSSGAGAGAGASAAE